MFSSNKLLDEYFAKHPSSDRNSYDEEVFHSFIIDYATKNHLDLEMIYSKFDEDTFYQEENKTDELVCKEVAKYYDKSIYLKLIYELTKEPLSINEQLNIVDSFNLVYYRFFYSHKLCQKRFDEIEVEHIGAVRLCL